MILEGSTITDYQDGSTAAAISTAQLLSVKHRRKESTTSVKHSTAQETPVPIYVGLMLHSHTRKKELVDRLHHLGLSISYDCVLCFLAQIKKQCL